MGPEWVAEEELDSGFFLGQEGFVWASSQEELVHAFLLSLHGEGHMLNGSCYFSPNFGMSMKVMRLSLSKSFGP